jgi:hypothetical protein
MHEQKSDARTNESKFNGLGCIGGLGGIEITIEQLI